MAEPTTPEKQKTPTLEAEEEPQNSGSAPPPMQESIQPKEMPESLRTLIEAFPNTEPSTIEQVLESHNGNVEQAFELLLRMSDPDYTPEESTAPLGQADDDSAPPMPPRPNEQSDRIPTGGQHFDSSTEQMRRDEELARQLALEDDRELEQLRQRQRNPQQPQEQRTGDDINFSEEFTNFKEGMIEAGNAVKKKAMDMYAQFKASRNSPNTQANSSIPTNAQYRGLPNDEEDLLTGDMSALHLSENDVYAGTRPRDPNVIHVNQPPSQQLSQSATKTSTSEEQLRNDERLARQLANDWQDSSSPRNTPPRTSFVAAPRSPLEYHEESDITPPVTDVKTGTKDDHSQFTADDGTGNSKPYVISNEDSDDESDLVDAEESAVHEGRIRLFGNSNNETMTEGSAGVHKPDENATKQTKEDA